MSPSDPSHLLRACLDAFAADSQSVGRRLRYLLDHNPAVFDHVALTLLAEAADTPAVRYTLALLAARGRLAPLVRRIAAQDPGSAGMLAHIAQKVDASLGGALGQDVCGAGEEPGESEARQSLLCPLGEALRGGLDLFTWLASGRKIDDKSKSRLAKVMGRGISMHVRLLEFLADANPRVRANAVESIWNAPGEIPRELFLKAAQDPNHRVAANALVGLYLNGDVGALSRLLDMASSPEPLFQAAAVWAMGRTGDERFELVLKSIRSRGRASAALLRNVLPAMARIRQSRQTREARNSRITILDASSGRDSACFVLSAQTQRGSASGRLRPVEFHPYHDGEPIWDYEVQSVEPSGPVHVSWLLPSSATDRAARGPLNMEMLTAAIESKALPDSWSVGCYRESRPSHFAMDSEDVPRLSGCPPDSLPEGLKPPKPNSDSGLILADTAALDAQVQPQYICAAAAAAVQPLGGKSARAHLVIVVDLVRMDALDVKDLKMLSGRLAARGVICHLLATSRAYRETVEGFRPLARDSGGWVFECEVESSPAAAASIASAIRRHWRLTLPATGIRGGLSLRIVSGTWRDETQLPMPSTPAHSASAA